jgi:predicted transcriptional regulator
MAVDRLSVTVPSELGAALRALAERRGETVSTIVTDAIASQVRLAALDLALADADRRFGAVGDDLVARAEAQLSGSSQPRRRKPVRRARTK